MSGSKVTIVDIAKSLGISKTATSSALHGGGRVSDDTRQRVLEQASAMGYVSNRAAQRLRGGAYGAIGIHVPTDVRNLSFYMEFTFGVADVAAELGHDLLLLTGSSMSSAAERPSGIDGLVVIDPSPTSFSHALAQAGDVPVVSVGDYVGPEHSRIDAWIMADQGGLVIELLDILHARGCLRPAIVGLAESREPLWASYAVEAYRRWCAQQSRDPILFRLDVTPTDAQLRETLDLLTDQDADSVIWVGQGHALRALAVDRHPQEHPRSSMVMARMAAEPGTAGLLGVDLHAREYGRSAARLLYKVKNGEVDKGVRVAHQADIVSA